MHAGLPIVCRRAGPGDALCLGVLATQVFLDTYASDGIDAGLAREVLAACSPQALEARLRDPAVQTTLAEREDRVVAFLEVAVQTTCPVAGVAGHEVHRLYVQRPFQRRGLGSELMRLAVAEASTAGAASLWLTAWSGNQTARAFYAAQGFLDIGTTHHVFEGRGYENRVFAKALTVRGM